jgi:hypothetical protein
MAKTNGGKSGRSKAEHPMMVRFAAKRAHMARIIRGMIKRQRRLSRLLSHASPRSSNSTIVDMAYALSALWEVAARHEYNLSSLPAAVSSAKQLEKVFSSCVQARVDWLSDAAFRIEALRRALPRYLTDLSKQLDAREKRGTAAAAGATSRPGRIRGGRRRR